MALIDHRRRSSRTRLVIDGKLELEVTMHVKLRPPARPRAQPPDQRGQTAGSDPLGPEDHWSGTLGPRDTTPAAEH